MKRPRQSPARQRGFTLVELSIVLFIGSGFMMAMVLSMHAHMLQLRAQTMAQRYQGVHDALERYVQRHRPALLALPADCSEPAYQAVSPRPPASAVALGLCALTLRVQGRDIRVANGLQPGLEELQALGLLDAGVGQGLALDLDLRVYTPSLAGQPATLAPPRLAVLLRKQCDTSACTSASGIETLVYNPQPFLLSGGSWALDRKDQVHLLFQALGDGAAMSQYTAMGQLVGAGERVSLDNPVKEPGGPGALGIVALRQPPKAEADELWARRDGRSTITGDWDFAANRLQGVSSLGARSVEAQDLQLSGRADLNTAKVQALEVERLNPQHVRLPPAEAGQPCDPGQSHLAIDPGTGRLLTCSATQMLWALP